jgi:hypothetical protein
MDRANRSSSRYRQLSDLHNIKTVLSLPFGIASLYKWSSFLFVSALQNSSIGGAETILIKHLANTATHSGRKKRPKYPSRFVFLHILLFLLLIRAAFSLIYFFSIDGVPGGHVPWLVVSCAHLLLSAGQNGPLSLLGWGRAGWSCYLQFYPQLSFVSAGFGSSLSKNVWFYLVWRKTVLNCYKSRWWWYTKRDLNNRTQYFL